MIQADREFVVPAVPDHERTSHNRGPAIMKTRCGNSKSLSDEERHVPIAEKLRRFVPWLLIATDLLVGFGPICGVRMLDCGSNRATAAEEPAKKSEKLPADEESWGVIYLGKSRIGYMRSESKTVMRDGRPIVRTANDSMMILKRFGQTLKTKTRLETEETPTGDLLNFLFEMQNPPASPTVTRGTIQEDKLLLETTIAGKLSKKSIPWDASLKSPGYQDRIMRDPPLKPGEKREFKTFLPELAKVATVVMQATKEVEVSLLGNEQRKLLQVDVT